MATFLSGKESSFPFGKAVTLPFGDANWDMTSETILIYGDSTNHTFQKGLSRDTGVCNVYKLFL
jgi:hypothetical protein